ncbi:2'-5' RNA ligase [Longimycelium tulufanense]|uniref:2'-5' RNA ligase n=1 Tax=Longimycelium tulufanense TaxID=907463 RepID=A0A8J3FTB4_9PSEU|nr:2'-5' RNA ligase family protein [Longimycelium tulufanense]GGM44591.1 2'-5' RNA ligase [Longimycelium tulufanense]
MADALEMFFDDRADEAVRALWRRLEESGVSSLPTRTHRRHRPHVSLAVAGTIPSRTRAALRGDLALLSIPALWLYTLGTFPTEQNGLFLGAVVDTELIAVHSAVHDTLASKVKHPSAYYLPGAWVPHCSLAQDIPAEQLVTGFAALHPVEPIRAEVVEIGVTDTRTGEVDVLLSRQDFGKKC